MTTLYYIKKFNPTIPRYFDEVDVSTNSTKTNLKICLLKWCILRDLQRKNFFNKKHPTLGKTLKDLNEKFLSTQDESFFYGKLVYQVTPEGIFYGSPRRNIYDLDLDILRFLLHGSYKECLLSSKAELNLHILENLEISNMIPFTDRVFVECTDDSTIVLGDKSFVFRDILIKNSYLLKIANIIEELYLTDTHDITRIIEALYSEEQIARYTHVLETSLINH